MQPFTVMTRRWFPPMVAAAVAGLYLPPLSFLIVFVFLLAGGVLLQLRELGLEMSVLYRRPANLATGVRVLLVFGGLSLISWSGGRGNFEVTASVLVIAGLLLDLVDGLLARRFPSSGIDRTFGAWFDRESDAAVLLALGLILAAEEGGFHPILIVGLSRYLWGMIFLLVPLSIPPEPRFARLSRRVAALAQVAAGASVGVLFFEASPRILRGPVLVWAWIAVLLVTLSFLVELILRIRNFRTLAGDSAAGLLRSFLVYYRLPLRGYRLRRFYREFLKQGALAFDIGAHLGNRIAPWLDLGARVVAVEPQPACVGLLQTWYGSRPACEIIPKGVGDEPGKLELLVSPNYPSLSSLDSGWTGAAGKHPLFNGVRWIRQGEVEVVTLSSLQERYGEPDFVKIDVEGFEARVLAGAGAPLKVLSFEFLPLLSGVALDCLDELATRGIYRYNFSYGEKLRFRFSQWISDAEIRSFLQRAADGEKSGDVYARLTEISQ